MTMASNERGFTAKDVRALCDVGASSKAKQCDQVATSQDAGCDEGLGQTGEKGIGECTAHAVRYILALHVQVCMPNAGRA